MYYLLVLIEKICNGFIFQNGITNVELSYPLTDESGNLRVLFAGEATEGSYYGTVHGAMISAEREVNRLQAESTSIT